MQGYTLVFINESPVTSVFCKTMTELNQRVAQIHDLSSVLVFAGTQLRLTRNVSHSVDPAGDLAVVPRKRGRPPGSKNKPKLVTTQPAASVADPADAPTAVPVPVEEEATAEVAAPVEVAAEDTQPSSVVDQVIEAMTTPHTESAPALSEPMPDLFGTVRRRRGRPAKDANV